MHYELCVIGNLIEHSKSPWIHHQFAKQLNLSINYNKIKPDTDNFLAAVHNFKKNKGYGFNVTFPFKQEAYKIASDISLSASIAKSVNTITIKTNNQLYGDNTDGIGLITDITKNLHYSLRGKILLIIGAGGAIRGILQPLLAESPAKVIIVNRTIDNARQLINEFAAYGPITYCNFKELNHLKVDAIIDGTSFNSNILLPSSLSLSENSLCYDLKYGDYSTSFIEWAKAKNSNIITDGLGMLIEQAAESFFIWTGRKPNTQPMIKLAREIF